MARTFSDLVKGVEAKEKAQAEAARVAQPAAPVAAPAVPAVVAATPTTPAKPKKESAAPSAPKVTEPKGQVKVKPENQLAAAPAQATIVVPDEVKREIDYRTFYDASADPIVTNAVKIASANQGLTPADFRKAAQAQGVSLESIHAARLKGRTYDQIAQANRERGVLGFMPVPEREATFKSTVERAESAARGEAPTSIKLKESGADKGLLGGYIAAGTQEVLPEVTRPGEYGYLTSQLLVDAIKKDPEASRIYDLYGRKLGVGNTQKAVEARVKQLSQRAGISAADPESDTKMRALRKRAINEIIAWKTVGQWTPAITMQDVQATEGEAAPGIFASLGPNVEIIGFNNDGQAITRQESPLSVLFRAIDLPQEMTVGALEKGGTAAQGVQTNANFLEFALDHTEDSTPLVRYPAVAAGLAASIIFPDALLAAGTVGKVGKAAKQIYNVRKIAPEATALLETIAKARSTRSFDKAKEAESALRAKFPAVADEFDRYDASAAQFISMKRPDSAIFDEDLSAVIAARVPAASEEVAAGRVHLHPSVRKDILGVKTPTKDTPLASYFELFNTPALKERVARAKAAFLSAAPATKEAYLADYARGTVRDALAKSVRDGKVTAAQVDEIADIVASRAPLMLVDEDTWGTAVRDALKLHPEFSKPEFGAVRKAVYVPARNGVRGRIARKATEIAGKDISDLTASDVALFDRAMQAIDDNNEARGLAASLLRDRVASDARIKVTPLNLFDDVAPTLPGGEAIRLSPGGLLLLKQIRKAMPDADLKELYASVSVIDRMILGAARKREVDPFTLYGETFPSIRRATVEDIAKFGGGAGGAPPTTPATPAAATVAATAAVPASVTAAAAAAPAASRMGTTLVPALESLRGRTALERAVAAVEMMRDETDRTEALRLVGLTDEEYDRLAAPATRIADRGARAELERWRDSLTEEATETLRAPRAAAEPASSDMASILARRPAAGPEEPTFSWYESTRELAPEVTEARVTEATSPRILERTESLYEPTVSEPTLTATRATEEVLEPTAKVAEVAADPKAVLRQLADVAEEAAQKTLGNSPLMPSTTLADGTFAGKTLELDAEGNVIVRRVADSVDNLTKAGQRKATLQELVDQNLIHGAGDSDAVSTSADAAFTKLYAPATGSGRVVGTFRIPLSDLTEMVRRGEATLGNVGEAEITFSGQSLERYLDNVDGMSVSAAREAEAARGAEGGIFLPELAAPAAKVAEAAVKKAPVAKKAVKEASLSQLAATWADDLLSRNPGAVRAADDAARKAAAGEWQETKSTSTEWRSRNMPVYTAQHGEFTFTISAERSRRKGGPSIIFNAQAKLTRPRTPAEVEWPVWAGSYKTLDEAKAAAATPDARRSLGISLAKDIQDSGGLRSFESATDARAPSATATEPARTMTPEQLATAEVGEIPVEVALPKERLVLADDGEWYDPRMPAAPAEAEGLQYLSRPRKGRSAREMEQLLAEAGGDLSAVVRKLADTTKVPEYRAVANRLLELEDELRQVQVDVVRPGDANVGAFFSNGGRLGEFDPGANRVRLLGPEYASRGMSEEVLLHEALHAVTAKRLSYDRIGSVVEITGASRAAVSKAREELRGIVSELRDHVMRAEAAGTATAFERSPAMKGYLLGANGDELVSWALTNPAFQDYLKSVKIRAATTLWDRFVQTMATLLGFKAEETSALARVLEASDNLMKAPYTLPSGARIATRDAIISALKNVGFTANDAARDAYTAVTRLKFSGASRDVRSAAVDARRAEFGTRVQGAKLRTSAAALYSPGDYEGSLRAALDAGDVSVARKLLQDIKDGERANLDEYLRVLPDEAIPASKSRPATTTHAAVLDDFERRMALAEEQVNALLRAEEAAPAAKVVEEAAVAAPATPSGIPAAAEAPAVAEKIAKTPKAAATAATPLDTALAAVKKLRSPKATEKFLKEFEASALTPAEKVRVYDSLATKLEKLAEAEGGDLKLETLADTARAAEFRNRQAAETLLREGGQALRQVSPTGATKGAVDLLADGRQVIILFEGADVSTVLHEAAHIIRRNILSTEDMSAITAWVTSRGVRVGHEFGEFTGDAAEVEKAEELFAQAFERYVMEGRAPTPSLTNVFDILKQALLDIYRGVRDPVLGVNLKPEVRAVFDGLLADVPEQASPTLKQVLRREMLGTDEEEVSGPITLLSREAARKGMPRTSEEDIVRQIESAQRRNVPQDQVYVSFPAPVMGKRDWTFDDLANLQATREEARSTARARERGIRLDLTGRGYGEAAQITEDSAVETLRGALAAVEGETGAKAVVRGALRTVAATFFGGDVVKEKGMRLLPPELRRALDTSERVVEQGVGDTVSLLNDALRTKNDRALFRFLGGGTEVRRVDGRPILSAGYDYMGAVRNMFSRAIGTLDTDEVDALKQLADAVNSSDPGKALATLGFNKDGTKFRAADAARQKTQALAVKAINKILYLQGKAAESDFGSALASALRGAVDASPVPRPTHEMRLVEAITYISGVTARDGKMFVGDSATMARTFAGDVRSIYNEESARRVLVLVGGFGSADKAKLQLVKLNLGVTEDTKRAFSNWLVGESWDPAQSENIQRLVDRYGMNPEFVKDSVLDTTFYVPRLARERMAKALARSTYRPDVAATGADTFNAAYRYMKTRMTRGSFFIRQRYYMMNTVDHFIQLGMTAGFGVAASSVTRVIAQDLMVLPFWQQLVEAARKLPGGQRIPEDILEITRRGLQRGGDVAAQRIAKLFGVGKYRIEVNPILEGLNGGFRADGKVYSYREIRNIAVEEGIFASFDTRELANAIQREGELAIRGQGALTGGSALSTSSGSGMLNDFFADWQKTVSNTAEAWGERERLGAMVALMEAGHDPRTAARLTIDALYDYSQSMTKADRSLLVGVLFPFWAFQKNANAQVFNLMFSPWGAYRMMCIRRARERGAELLAEVLYNDVGNDYGVDVKSMPPELQDSFYSIVTAVENEYNGEIPDDVKRAMRLLFTGRGRDIMDGRLVEASAEIQRLREVGAFAEMQKFAEYAALPPDEGARGSYTRDRIGVPVMFPRTAPVRQYYRMVGDQHSYIEAYLPESSIEAGFKHHTQFLAAYVLMGAAPYDFLTGNLTEQGYKEVTVKNVLSPVADPARSPVIGPLLADVSPDLVPPTRLSYAYTAPAQTMAKVHPGIGKQVDDLFGTTFLRVGAINDPFVGGAREGDMKELSEESIREIKMLQEQYPDSAVLRDQRYYLPGGVWSTLFQNSPLGEFNNLAIRYEENPAERADIRGEMLRWARGVMGLDVEVVSPKKTVQREEPKKLKETKNP